MVGEVLETIFQGLCSLLFFDDEHLRSFGGLESNNAVKNFRVSTFKVGKHHCNGLARIHKYLSILKKLLYIYILIKILIIRAK